MDNRNKNMPFRSSFPPAGYNPPSKRFFGRDIGVDNWSKICTYLSSIKDVRIHICYGCGFVKLYDKNNIEYKARRMDKLNDVELLVDKIRKINEG